MNKVLVTGGAGFIGSNLVDVLLNNGLEVIIIDDLSTGKVENINSKATFIEIDLASVKSEKLIDILDGVEVVFHLAALARVQPSIDKLSESRTLSDKRTQPNANIGSHNRNLCGCRLQSRHVYRTTSNFGITC